MKYGETLRQRSIPAWSHHNIDYDDIKYFIKEHTTPGQGKSVSVPGRGDDKLIEFENALFHILADQHQRIDLFVKSKSGEIQRRLEHAKKQLRSLSSRNTTTADQRIPVGRLERYGKLENDVIKASDEIRSLARFTATQRTAFRKLLKKYKKWTGSSELEERVRDVVLDNPKSFTRLDLGPLLDEYSATRQRIRALYEAQVQQPAGGKKVESRATNASSSAIQQLGEVVESGSRVYFDTSIATVPLGESGTIASYFVHPENIVELQVLLLQYSRFYFARSRSNSIASPITTEARNEMFPISRPECTDFHMLVADNIDRFVNEQSGLTVDDREHKPGMFPQRAKGTVRWNDEEDALACLLSKSGKTKSAFLRRKHIHDFFDGSADFMAKQDVALVDSADSIEEVRRELLKDDTRPLFRFSSGRTRFVGDNVNADGLVMATLDTDITITKAGVEGSNGPASEFPLSLLMVRQEGEPKSDLLAALDKSHLVERVRGFSLEYHSIWQTHHPENIPAPFWEPLLSRDIRKLPPPAMKRSNTNTRNPSGTQSGDSSSSLIGTTDSGTAVESPQLDSPPLKSFRKKKRRAYPQADAIQPVQQRYWNEYDHPEDDDAPDPDAFVLFVDPHYRSGFDRFFDNIAKLFGQQQYTDEEQQGLLANQNTPDDEESSDDEAGSSTAVSKKSAPRPATHFGTFTRQEPSTADVTRQQDTSFPYLGHFASVCYAASLVLLLVAYIFHTTARHRYLQKVHFGVLFCMIFSLIFVALGFLAVARSGNKSRPVRPAVWIVSIVVLVIDAVGSGGLLAWILG
ncbi:uncharacterized protein RCC_06829 [Ramularia collo-cygni]|uniref:SPX domain-containing protein n=1 Tax=Ramularia collo-cygni TaxID=112498 RepID=A0A2D3UZN4_9PEZI|nr:uncharacterized protein RCC_06829 [Ramularia collo-cygni]CZT20968.1 uncharacterized protein RCC_06829 [Ramularia collo-cygni]